MKEKNAFTLIELLAVIVVLAIIALIATPIVMNTINNAKKGATERSAENYIDAVEIVVSTKRLDGNILEGEYLIQTDGNLCPTSGCGENDKDKVIVEVNGNKPTSGTIVIKDGQVTTDSKMTIGEYIVHYDETTKRYAVAEPKKYNNGEVVYFNVDTGTKCTSSEAVSTTGTKSGCMKFYAFNDDGGNTLNLILDHNTTAKVAWNSNNSNTSGPKEVLEQLKNDTDTWQGTITPTNYTMDQTGQLNNAKYTIDYSDYKARLITANEIATITDYSEWDEKVAINSDWYYLDSKTTVYSNTCKSGNTSGCQYGWLYDRTNKSCTEYGCLNNSDQDTYGYWTASSRANNSSNAWHVGYTNSMSNYNVSISPIYGVRPVITVSKSKLN